MERKYFCIDLVLAVSFLAFFCLILFLGGFYLGFSETYELNTELSGIRFSGGNLYRDRALRYGIVAVLLLVSLVIHSYKRRAAKIIGASILLVSIFPVWDLFISTE